MTHMTIPGVCPPLFAPKREREVDRNAPTEGIELVVNSVVKAALWALSSCPPAAKGLLLLCKINLYRTFPNADQNADQKSENEKSEKALARFALITSLFFGLIGAYQKQGVLTALTTGTFFAARNQYLFESKMNRPPFDYKGLDRFPIERFKMPSLPEVLKESTSFREDILSTFQREIRRYAESREGDQIKKALEELCYLEIPSDVCGRDRDSQNEKAAQKALSKAYNILIEKRNQAIDWSAIDWSADGIPTALAIGEPNSQSALSQDFLRSLFLFSLQEFNITGLKIYASATKIDDITGILDKIKGIRIQIEWYGSKF